MVVCKEGERQPDSVRFRTLDFNLVAPGSNPSLTTSWVASHADAFLLVTQSSPTNVKKERVTKP